MYQIIEIETGDLVLKTDDQLAIGIFFSIEDSDYYDLYINGIKQQPHETDF